MILIIDNYDSFVHNLARYCRELGHETQVKRNDKITTDAIRVLKPTHIILSPGPCAPDQAGICLMLVEQFSGEIPILGVCLGHQVIGQAFGGKIVKAKQPVHGKSSLIKHHGNGLFVNCLNPFPAARYHSLAVELPKDSPLVVDAWSEDNQLMAFHHKHHPTYGVQFHPESILTPAGKDLLQQFLMLTIH